MYVVERWLARLSRSVYADDFVLKGGMLLASFGVRRPTVDADALARNMASDQLTVSRRVAEIAAIEDPEDGVEFLTGTITAGVIRQDAVYSGVRVAADARLATARVKFRLDVSFGDPVIPAPRRVQVPALRPGAAPIHVLGYPVETVLAEKLVTAIDLGLANTRVRDFADVYILTSRQSLRYRSAREALTSTASFRNVPLRPLALTTAGLGRLRGSDYTAYRRNLGGAGDSLPEQLQDAVDAAIAFVDPLVGDGFDDHAEWNSVGRKWIRAGRPQ